MGGRPEDDDGSLFREAMADVQRLEQDRSEPRIVVRTPISHTDREREVLRALDAILSGEEPIPLHETDQYVEGAVPGVDPRMLRRMRKGEFSAQADLDLHGVDAETGRRLVERFVLDCHARGLRFVRIVHGRGRNSPDGVPVLKNRLPRWLSKGPARLLVLAYTSAPPHDGGAGASYVLLRRNGGRRSGSDPL